MATAALKKADGINMQSKKLKTVKKTVKTVSEYRETEDEKYLKDGPAPKWLSPVGRYHYKKLVVNLKNAGLYNPLDSGLIEAAADCYAKMRDETLDSKTRMANKDQYSRLVAQLGERGGIGATVDEEGSEDDLREFILTK